MEGSRTHSFLIIGAAAVFILGFFCGLYAVGSLSPNSNDDDINKLLVIGADNIMMLRIKAIEEARRKGKQSYEFDVSGPHPAMNKF